MTGGTAQPQADLVYRPTFVRGLFAVCLAGALWWVVAVAAGPSAGDLRVGVPVVAAAAAVGYAAFWRAAVVVGADGVRLLNVVRDVHVPFAALDHVDTRFALTLVAGGRGYRSWAAAAPGRPALLRFTGRGPLAEHLPDPRWTAGGSAAPAASRSLAADSGAAAFMVEQGWSRWRDTPRAGAQPPPAPVTVRWNVPVLAAAVGGSLLAVLAGALGG